MKQLNIDELNRKELRESPASRNGHAISAVEARAAIEEDRQERIQACREKFAEFEKILNENNCYLDVAILVRPNGNVPQLAIVAKD